LLTVHSPVGELANGKTTVSDFETEVHRMSKLKGFGIFGIAMVLGLMAMMVPSAVLADDEEGPIRVIRACLAPPCQEGNGVVIQLDDGSSYRVCFVGHEGNTWTYFVQEVCTLPTIVEDPRFLSDVTIPDFVGICGKDLSHWALGLEKCLLDKVIGYDPDGAEVGTDGSTGFVGISVLPLMVIMMRGQSW